ncbi:winged helix-turn-helix domain-containing protein [Halopiger djelfimassiliensis]|uniref:winged helix-turn-helix domain-containing protein n=1 Tax=Halopiger djelfimassiliensis TaxID=1293047 RepID=UPI000A54C140|nr:winged helix-turn-helix domain-containing protein [Halopiger djelfimassiliensis]
MSIRCFSGDEKTEGMVATPLISFSKLSTRSLEIGPAAIARNIDKSQSTVHERLRVLIEYRLVENVDDGYYTITDDGHAYLEVDSP